MGYDSVGGEAIDMGVGVDLADLQQVFAMKEAENDTHADEDGFLGDELPPEVTWVSLHTYINEKRNDLRQLQQKIAESEEELSALEGKLPLQSFAGRSYLGLSDDSGVLFSDGEQMSWKALNDWIMSVLKSQSALPATPASTPAQPAPTTVPTVPTQTSTQMSAPLRKGRKPARYTGSLEDLQKAVAGGDWRHARIDWATADVQAFLRDVKDIPKRLAFIHAAISSEDRVAFCTPERLEAWKKELHFDSCFKSA